MSKYYDDIIRLHKEGKTRMEIKDILKCSNCIVCYYLTYDNQPKNKTYKSKNNYRKSLHPFVRKVEKFKSNKSIIKDSKVQSKNLNKILSTKIRNFFYNKKDKVMTKINFTTQDVINKFGENTTCYLTGDKINIYDVKSYEFDHIIPVSRGGDNSLENLGICTKEANRCKERLTPEEFLELCKKVVKHLTKNK